MKLCYTWKILVTLPKSCLQLINRFSKVAGYKINLTKQQLFKNANAELRKKGNQEIPFRVVINNRILRDKCSKD